MDAAQQIQALAAELARLRADFRKYDRALQQLKGIDRAFQAAVLALVATHPRPDLLAQGLREYLARLEASAVAVDVSDEHVRGVQQGQEVLLAALADAESWQNG